MIDERDRPRFDPRSPVQDGRSAAPYFVAALVAAILIWTAEQYWVSDLRRPSIRNEAGRRPSSDGTPRGARGGDVRTVFTADDYPASAAINGEEGTVQAKLTVDPAGRVSSCTIIRTSGHASLDLATCSILRRRARFTPARDAEGKAVASTFVTPPVRWQLEG